MNIDLIRTQYQRFSSQDFEPSMRAMGVMDEIIKCDYKDFFNLKLLEVQNLYRADKKGIRMRHESDNVISKCEGPLRESGDFEVDFDDKAFIESGINFIGRIRLTKNGRDTVVRVFGEGTFDPASREKYLSKHDYIVINGFCVVALYGCRRGAKEDFIARVFKLAKNSLSARKHPLMLKYMKYQIKTAAAGTDSRDYGGFLRLWVDRNRKNMLKKKHEDLFNYTYTYDQFDKSLILPCKTYIDLLVKYRQVNHFLIAFTQLHPEVYLRPTTDYVKKLCGMSTTCIDLRELEESAQEIEDRYTQKIREAMAKRGGDSNDRPKLRDLATKYYNCCVF
ncbi:hypothetical protein SteCoe_32286 [Stentor coeruleus]|uniref:Uncharacterized protein n=1 Tax=Stentor coeruleus TaxID=5963 RepID=A0A1R2AZB1_9CILI|nr:hypothetical protein SteCoe_32286 [Stentor coeruleus]